MPKINVYLPDDLAAAVRRAGVPVSAVCQEALTEAVRAAGAARQAAAALRDPVAGAGDLAAQVTPRLRAVLRRAAERAGERAPVEPEHLLAGLLDAGDNLALRILQLIDARVPQPAPAPPAADLGPDDGVARLSPAGRAVLAAALDGAADLGHGFLGTEHLLLGLAAEGALPDAAVTPERVRKAIPAAIGAARLGHTRPAADLGDRLAAVERRLDAAGL